MATRTKMSRKISMGFLTGVDMVDKKPGDHIFEYGGEAWFFKKLGEIPKNCAWPRGVLAYVGPNAGKEGKWFGDISCAAEFGSKGVSSPDFDSYEEAIEWTIKKLEENGWI